MICEKCHGEGLIDHEVCPVCKGAKPKEHKHKHEHKDKKQETK